MMTWQTSWKSDLVFYYLPLFVFEVNFTFVQFPVSEKGPHFKKGILEIAVATFSTIQISLRLWRHLSLLSRNFWKWCLFKLRRQFLQSISHKQEEKSLSRLSKPKKKIERKRREKKNLGFLKKGLETQSDAFFWNRVSFEPSIGFFAIFLIRRMFRVHDH